jgi:hypothetical protein
VGHVFCVIDLLGCATKAVAKSALGDLFSELTSWVLSSVQWLLTAVGAVLSSASDPSTIVGSANQEFNVLLVAAPILMMLGLLVATIQAVRHGDGSSLWRVYFGVAPACVMAIVIARPVATLILQAIDELVSGASTTVVAHEATLASVFANLPTGTNIPGFGIFLLCVGVVVGAWLLWCELIVRSVILTLLLVLVPLIVPLSTFPALRRLGWRLAETFVAVASSKLLIVVALSLGLDELEGGSATMAITGAVTLLLATCTPFVLLKVIPFVEQSALHNLEGLRSRFTRSVQNAPSSPLGAAARSLIPDAPLPGPTPRAEDLGLGMWESEGDVEMPTWDGPSLPPPIGVPQTRGGHVAYSMDELGPVIGWHFDE